MKNSLLALLILMSNYAHSQGLIVNEISNGTIGTKEFIELLVVGSSSNPLGQVDVNGWVIDDNNGDFDASTSSGVASGHYRFVDMPVLNVGDIIVVYNPSDINLNMVADDPNDSNGDGVYVFPINYPYIERCLSIPSSSSPSYLGSTYSYSPSQTSNSMGFRNGGDAVQVRKPDYTFYHGFSYGDVSNNFPTFPNGVQSFNVASGSGTRSNYFLDCGDWTSQSNYSKGNAIGDTPAMPNTSDNLTMISLIKGGNFDYDNLSNPSNCTIVFNIEDLNLSSNNHNNDNILTWYCDDYENFLVQYSLDCINFNDLKYSYCGYTHTNISSSLYYRLICYGDDGGGEVSKTIFQEYKSSDGMIFPNPVNNVLNLLEDVEYEIISIDGKVISSGQGRTIDVYYLPSSVYFIKIKGDGYVKVLKIVKE